MALKISRGVWFVSILGLLAALLYIYAGLPEKMLLLSGETDFLYASRETFFYVFLAAITVVNTFVFLVGSLFRHDQALRTWFNVLVVILNLFFVICLLLMGAINSNEKVNYERIGLTIYASVWLIAIWSLAWPIYALVRKFSHKPTV